ncbi:MAG: helix-turn-helix domain-containing protein [Candidimonas sp.]|nr:helix-turn-helix domain-containing protein [Candidimonas sp.]
MTRMANQQPTSVQKALSILKAIELHHESGLRLTDLCRLLQLEKPTALRLAGQLIQEQLVIRHPASKKYYLGPYCQQLGETLAAHSALSRQYVPLLKRISARTEDASFLVVLQDLDTLCIAREVGTFPIQALSIPVGNRQPIGVGAGGLAMLASLDHPTCEHYLESNRKRFLKYKSLKLTDLRMRIDKARKKGYAVIGSHAVNRVIGVGVTLCDKEENIVGGISVASLDNRMTAKRQEAVAAAIREEMTMFLDKG